jgi:dihydrofolate reductase
MACRVILEEESGEDQMRKVIVDEFMTLDGVVQSPGYVDEDPSGGFKHGGWHMPHLDERAMKWISDGITSAGGFLLGRRTYEIFAAFWPNAGKEQEALARPLNTRPKYVASRTLKAPLAWQNSSLLEGDIASAVAALKEEDGQDLHVIGSTQLVQTLIEEGLADQIRVMLDPVTVGGGKRLFRDDGALRSLKLVDSQVTSKGSILNTYAVASETVAPSRATMRDAIASR